MSERHDRGARPIGVRLRVALRAAVVLAGSVAAAPTSAQAAPQVVVTIKPLHSLVAAVMDGLAVPTLLLPGAGSPHGASLKPSQARALREAELVFWIGPELEGTLVKPLRALATEARVIAATELDGVRLWSVRAGGVWLANARAPDSHDPGIAARDPHLWLDPGNAEQIVRAAVAALSAADPANAARLTRNGAATIARLRALDRELAATLAPVKNLSYLAFHDSTQYFERRYGLAAVGSIATSPERPPGAKRLREIRRRLSALGAVCIFSEPQFRSALVTTVANGTALRTGELDPLGADLAPGPDAYFDLLRGLADAVRACLAPNG